MLVIAIETVAYAQEPYTLTGDFWGTHDPSIAKEGKTWYVFATGKAASGGQIPIRCSDDLGDWRYCGQVFDAIPEWIHKDSPGTPDLWAPDISLHDGEYRLYYAYSLFGKNTSGIALITNKTLDSRSSQYKWVDHGLVLRTTATDNYNAIDPNFIRDEDGGDWLAFGSYWSGIKLRRLGPDGKLSSEDTTTYSLAAREPPQTAVEAPFISYHEGYYYLFVSWDQCCKGAKSTYRTMVGRARKITGPYLDKTGKDMMAGGGTEILSGNEVWRGPGGASVWTGSSAALLVFHAYDAATGKRALQISTIQWEGGWPEVALETEHASAPN